MRASGDWRYNGVLSLAIGAANFVDMGIGLQMNRNSAMWEGDIGGSGCQNGRSRRFEDDVWDIGFGIRQREREAQVAYPRGYIAGYTQSNLSDPING